MYKTVYCRCYYDLQKSSFSCRVVNIWNSLLPKLSARPEYIHSFLIDQTKTGPDVGMLNLTLQTEVLDVLI